jgi:hypothetical protein
MSNDIDALLAKATATPAGQIRVVHFAPLFDAVALGWADEARHPQAETMMKTWAEGNDPLAKGMAQHWLDRAHATVESGMAAGKKAESLTMGRKVHPMIARILASKKKRPVVAAK